MKQLKKHPKQQRMEDITFPIIRLGKCFYHPKEPAVIQSGTPEYNFCKKCWAIHFNKEKVTMTGREYLRSINDDNGFTLMPRIVWRVVAVGLLIGVVVWAVYVLP